MAVNLTRIYTRTGDAGETRLGDNSTISKTDPRLAAYGEVDEANSAIGVAIAAGQLNSAIAVLLTRVQNDLFEDLLAVGEASIVNDDARRAHA